jgi:Tfp pilus assembly protein PilF
MKNISLSILVAALMSLQAVAQEQDVKTMQENARTFLKAGDINNAIIILNKASEKDPSNIDVKKDLALAYYVQRDYAKALDVAKVFPEDKNADVQSFQVLAMIYKAVEERKEAEKVYRTALKKFPNSGVLYNEFGEMLWAKKDLNEAVKQWEKGIETDPNFPGNYYNAAKYYYASQDKIWGILYGEIFINLESFTKRTPEIKSILLDSYKKLFIDADIYKNQEVKNEFVKAILDTYKKHSSVIESGVTPESISALRSRFILDWFQKDAARFPFRLFEHHKQLLGNGMFESYNQWIFGAAKDLEKFQQWTSLHANEYNQFTTLQKNRVFKIPEGQYYNKSDK